MSEFGEAIIQRLNNTELQKTDNPMNRIIQNTCGEWMDKFDDKKYFEQFFIQEADGKYLDLHGKDFNIPRRIDEDDETYRQRIVNASLGHVTVNFLKSVYNVDLFTYKSGFTPYNNDLVSDNPYLSNRGFMGNADTDTQNILEKKFVLGSEVSWL